MTYMKVEQFLVPREDAELLLAHAIPTARPLCKGAHWTFRRVPAARVDILELASHHRAAATAAVFEIGRKVGSFDGRTRVRLCVRWLLREPETVTPARMTVDSRHDTLSVFVVRYDDAVGAVLTWPALRSELLPERDPAEILGWHVYGRNGRGGHYGFLAGLVGADGIDAESAIFRAWVEARTEAGDPPSLVECNRQADRQLYRLARDHGWRKLTAKERARLGLADKGQWTSPEAYDAAQAALSGYRATGASDYSHDAARGRLRLVEVTR